MAINISKKDVVWSYFSLFLLNGINVILLPFILAYLSESEIGLWYTFTAVSGLVIILDFGFQTTLSRNVTFVWEGAEEITVSGFKQGNKEGPNYNLFAKLFKVTKIIYLMIGLVIFILLFTLGTWHIYTVSKDELETSLVLISWGLYATAVFLNMKYAYWNAILKGIGAIKLHQQILIITKLTQLVLSIIGILFGYGLIAVSLAYFISIIVNRTMAHFRFYSYQNNKIKVKPIIKDHIDKREVFGLLKKILPNTYKQGLISISNYINLRSTTLLSSAYLGLGVTASLGLVLQIINLIMTVSNTFFNTYLPQFSSYRINKQFGLLKEKFKQAIFINYCIVIIAFTILLFFGNWLLAFLDSNATLLDWKYLIVILAYMFLYNNQSVFGTFIATDNRLPHYKAFFISSIVIIGIQFFLMNFIENTLWNLIIPIFLIQLLYNNWRWPYEVYRDFKKYNNLKM